MIRTFFNQQRSPHSILKLLATAYLLSTAATSIASSFTTTTTATTTSAIRSSCCLAFQYHPRSKPHQRKEYTYSSLLPMSALSRVSISDAFDGGNIEYVSQEEEQASSSVTNGHDGDTTKKVIVKLRIKPDPYTELEEKSHFQYFSFRSTLLDAPSHSETTATTTPTTVFEYVIENAGDASYAVAWDESTVFYTTSSVNDALSWKRKVDTKYQDGKLSWTHSFGDNNNDGSSFSVHFSYFPPYSYARHLDLIAKCASSKIPNKTVRSLGQTLDGREIECIQVGTGSTIGWIIHRQHPGEHMAEYYAEGLLTRLLGLNTNGDVDGLVRKLLSMYTFYIVPSMNPDGAYRGHLRTNVAGANLNREWTDSPNKNYKAPTLERSPEVYYVLKKMDEVGCDVFLDIHGDEGLPYNFLAQASVPNWGPRLQALHGAFLASYSRTNPDMQQQYAYDPAVYNPEKDVLNKATNQMAYRFDCLSMTLEMPFKDCWSNPNPELGWSPARAIALGASVLDPLMYIHPYLRDESEFWKNLPESDAYIRPTSNYK